MPAIKENERIDATGFGTVKIIQDPEEFCYGVDAVVLSDFAAKRAKTIRKETRIIDLGTGSGIIPLILSHKTTAETIKGVEIQEASWDRAVRSAELNELTHKLEFINCDIHDLLRLRPELRGSFDIVTCNPPYKADNAGFQSAITAQRIARHEIMCNIDDVCRAAERLLKFGGRLCVCNRPERLSDVIFAMKNHNIEPKRLRFVSKNPDEARLLTKMQAYKVNRRADFEENKFTIMENGLRAKFAQNPAAAEMLKATGHAVLIKSCAVCYKCGFGAGSGQNRLGKMLMKIREELGAV